MFNNLAEAGGEDALDAALEARRTLRPLFIADDEFAPGVAEVVDTALDEWVAKSNPGPGGAVVDVLELCHDLCRRAVMLFICGEMAHDGNAMSVGSFHATMDHFVRRCVEPTQGPTGIAI